MNTPTTATPTNTPDTQSIATDNLDLALTTTDAGHTAVMELSGNMKPDTFDRTLEWIASVAEDADALNLKLAIAPDAFDDLGQASRAFRRVSDALRKTTAWDKCAVITDSGYLRNSFKVEGAVLPGIDVMTFAPDQSDAATAWIEGRPLETTLDKTEEHAPTQATTKWGNLDLAKVDY